MLPSTHFDQDFVPETVEELTATSWRLRRTMIFLSGQEFEQRFGYKLQALNTDDLMLQEVIDEAGQKVSGVCIADPQEPYRKLIIETQCGLQLGRTVAKDVDMVRAKTKNSTATSALKTSSVVARHGGSRYPRKL